MAEQKPCARCGDPTPTIDNLSDRTFWGMVKTSEVTTTERSIRVLSTDFKQAPQGDRLLRSDEEFPLCDACWVLALRFIRGDRPIPAVDHDHIWAPGGKLGTAPGKREGGYPIERCIQCEKTRLSEKT